MSNLSRFPERLKDLMFDAGQMTTRELADKIGVHFTTVAMWLKGGALISLSNAVKVADFFECSIDYLAGMSEIERKVTARELPPFYQNLRKVMAEQGFSRYRIAKDTEIKDMYFTKWSKGATPDLLSVMKVATYMNVSVDYLIGRTDY